MFTCVKTQNLRSIQGKHTGMFTQKFVENKLTLGETKF